MSEVGRDVRCRHCNRQIYIWQATWIHEPDGSRWCRQSPVAEPYPDHALTGIA